MRGIVVVPYLILDHPHGGLVGVGGETNLQQLRTWLMIWDRLARPTNSNIMVEAGPNFEYLESTGVLTTYHIRDNSGGSLSNIVQYDRTALYDHLNRESPGSWAIDTYPEEGDDVTGTAEALRVRLASAVPIPNQDVPLEDILRFRERREAERAALLFYIDQLYLDVLAAPDRPVGEQAALKKLTIGAKDLLDAVHDAKFPYRLASIAADFNLVGAGAVALVTAGLGQTLPSIVGNSLLAGSTVTISKVLGLFNSAIPNSPFRYVTQYSSEVFGPE